MALKKRNDGRYKVTYSSHGKRHYFYGSTRNEALAKREAFILELQKAPNIDREITVSEWLDEYLLDAKNRVARATYLSYESISRNHIRPILGDIALAKLEPFMIRDLLNKKQEDGCSTRTIEYIYVVLKAALTLAVNDGVLYRNPAASTGMRREEVLALRISDVNTRRHTVSINQTVHHDNRQTYITNTTKTDSSQRTILLDDETYELVREQIKTVQKRKASTFGYKDFDLLFPGPTGRPISPTQASKRLKTYAKKAKLPSVFTFHGLRHTHATLLLEAGANVKSIQVRLGHSSFKTTMDTYSHVTSNMEEDVLKKIPKLI